MAVLGADQVIDREAFAPGALKKMLPEGGVDAVADVVGGSGFSALIRMICQADGG